MSEPVISPVTPGPNASSEGSSGESTQDNSSKKVSEDQLPKSQKEIERERFKKEQQEAIAKMERERQERDKPSTPKPESKEQPKSESDSEEDESESKPAEVKKKLKVNGKEVELTEAEIIKRAQLYEAAEQKFQKASQVQRQAEAFVRALKEDPESVLSHPSLGVNLREFAEKVLYKHLEQDMMSPEERQRKQEQSELERYRQQEREQKEVARREQEEQLKEKYRQDWSRKMTEALEVGNLPKTDWTVQRMAQYMQQALRKGHKHIQPADVVDLVREDWMNAQRQMFSHLDPDKLVEILGQDIADKVRKHNLSKFEKEGNVSRQPMEDDQEDDGVRYGSIEEMLRSQKVRR